MIIVTNINSNDNDYQYHFAASNTIKKCIGALAFYVYVRLNINYD